MEYPKNFDFNLANDNWYQTWKESHIFDANNKSEKKPYSILMPPPNVTGILHFGHVLNHTLQDLYIRQKRMQGYEVCWFPGLDHAGIATQSRVEKELKTTENLTRYDLGRDKFLERVWQWKDKYGNIILNQLEKLGVSCDWDRTLFTMDESASSAVSEVFIKLFDEGLIYKGKRIINWSPLAQTALSDEEVEFREVNEHFYTMRYYFENGNDYLKVATVRPETIYGDVAIAVNPNDERYKDLIGTNVRIPLVNKLIPIIADDYADPTFGTGCVKITPAHDPNDFEVGLRHNLEAINTINKDATLNELTGEYNGLDRFVARKKIVEKLKELDLIEKIEDYTHNVGFSQRGGEPVEPYLSDQWFVKMKPLAEIALREVMNGDIKFHPNHWIKTYEHWMNNIKDWCISRQLWWGHRIPVYYTESGLFTAASNEEEARKKLGINSDVKIWQDEDVLDTWFSSWLWPLTTMGWKGSDETLETDDIKKFLPSDLLVTGPDIIFFWVARMIMATKKFKNEVPFKNVYFTSMIRDGQGRKLSKSLGNSPDPLNILDKYGADAVRFTMLYLAPLGSDVRMDVDVKAQDIPSMEIGRNFANKVWNAGRFLTMKKSEIEVYSNSNLEVSEFSTSDNWIYSRLNQSIKYLNESLDNFKVTDYSKALYDFIWRDFCDWYVEIFKLEFNSSETDLMKSKKVNFALSCLNDILKLLHPLMPFITEEIWHLINEKDNNISISQESYPEANLSLINEKLEKDFEFIQTFVEEFRKMRANANLGPSKPVKGFYSISEGSQDYDSILNQENLGLIKKLARLESFENQIPNDVITLGSVVRGIEVRIENNNIDIEKEIEKLTKEIERLEGQIEGINKKLSNETFVSKAPANVIENERKKQNDMTLSLETLKQNLKEFQNS